jgi:hypothetical protein
VHGDDQARRWKKRTAHEKPGARKKVGRVQRDQLATAEAAAEAEQQQRPSRWATRIAGTLGQPETLGAQHCHSGQPVHCREVLRRRLNTDPSLDD